MELSCLARGKSSREGYRALRVRKRLLAVPEVCKAHFTRLVEVGQVHVLKFDYLPVHWIAFLAAY